MLDVGPDVGLRRGLERLGEKLDRLLEVPGPPGVVGRLEQAARTLLIAWRQARRSGDSSPVEASARTRWTARRAAGIAPW